MLTLQKKFLNDLDEKIYRDISMNELLEVMQLIDRNSDKLPEGDYLSICNRLKKVYNERNDPTFFFDYENFEIPLMGPSHEVHDYFYDHYMNQALSLDMDYITGEIEYLRKELNQLQPLKRKTKNLKDVVVKHHCLSINLIPEEQTLETLGLNTEDVDSMTKSFMHAENTFRETYRNAIEKRLNVLEEALEKLYET
jgi:hypothetical protein